MQADFEKMILENLGRIRHISRRYSNGVEAEDIFQEILLQLWRSYDSFNKSSSLETWLYKVALNTSITVVRKSSKEKKGLQNLSSLFQEDEQPLYESSEENILLEFMGLISETDANVLMMYLDGLSASDIGNVIGISSNAVSARISRVRKQFESTYIGVNDELR